MNNPPDSLFHYREAFIALGTSNFDRSVQFYRQLLSQEPSPYLTDVYGEFRLINLKLGVFCPKESHSGEFGDSRGSGMSICLEVESLEQAIEHLSKIGYPPGGEISHASHGREIYIYDPDGNRLILHQSTAKTNPFK
jgi:catechol 2,3-dioxygenase-like lactoylglutathione lyase family enzyme